MDLCYEVTASGARAQDGVCSQATANGTITGITFDDPRSPFNGADRFMDVNANEITNAAGPKGWFTDPFGLHARPDSFPGAVRQFLARIDNTPRGLGSHGPPPPRDSRRAPGHPP